MPRIVLAFLLLTGLCSRSFASFDSGLLALVPANSQVVAGIDFDSSRSSAFGQFLLRQMSAHDNDLQQLIEQTGFDPRRDIQSLLFTVISPPNGKTPGSFAMLARGTFDQSRIKEAALKDGRTAQQFQGVELFVRNQGDRQIAFAFPETGLGVLGDLPSVKRVIENQSQASNLDPALQNQLSTIENNHAWFASVVPASSLASNVDPNLKNSMGRAQVLQAIVQSSGGISFGDTSNVIFNAETRSAQDAASLADVIRLIASMIQAQNGQTAPLAAALDSMKLDVAGSSVHLTLQLPEAALEQLVAMQHGRPAHSVH